MKTYSILLEDTGKTFNINCHTFDCYAISKEEAIGKMFFQRPDFAKRTIHKITEDNIDVYVNPDYNNSIQNALTLIKKRMLIS